MNRIEKLYEANFVPESLNLNDFIGYDLETTEEAKASVNRKTARPRTVDGYDENIISAPLTEEEALIIDEGIEKLRERISITKDRIGSFKSLIDSQAGGKDQVTVSIDITKKPTIRRAIQKVFGYKTNIITYEMYKAALDAKNLIEKQESEDYTG